MACSLAQNELYDKMEWNSLQIIEVVWDDFLYLKLSCFFFAHHFQIPIENKHWWQFSNLNAWLLEQWVAVVHEYQILIIPTRSIPIALEIRGITPTDCNLTQQ